MNALDTGALTPIAILVFVALAGTVLAVLKLARGRRQVPPSEL